MYCRQASGRCKSSSLPPCRHRPRSAPSASQPRPGRDRGPRVLRTLPVSAPVAEQPPAETVSTSSVRWPDRRRPEQATGRRTASVSLGSTRAKATTNRSTAARRRSEAQEQRRGTSLWCVPEREWPKQNGFSGEPPIGSARERGDRSCQGHIQSLMDDPQAFPFPGLAWPSQMPLSAAPPEKETKATAPSRPSRASEEPSDGSSDGAASSRLRTGDYLDGPDPFLGRAGAGEEAPAE